MIGLILCVLTYSRFSLSPGRWLSFLATATSLAFSAFYEFAEWWAALLGGDSAEALLGTQGDVWDTQWDMFLALVGAIAAPIFLGRFHDQSLNLVWVGGRGRSA